MPSRESDGKWKVRCESVAVTKGVAILFTEMLDAVTLSLCREHSRSHRPARI